ncbi:MAG: O-antigen ligase family protein [Thermoleophilia bacterium]
MSPGGVWTASLTGALFHAASIRLGAAWPVSATGRLLSAVWRVLRRTLAGSAFFSTASSMVRPAARRPASLIGRVAAGAFRVTVDGIGGGVLGRLARRSGVAADGSVLSGGAWVRPLGGALSAFALARLVAPWVGVQETVSQTAPLVDKTAGTAGLIVLALAGLTALVFGGVAPAGQSGVVVHALRLGLGTSPAVASQRRPGASERSPGAGQRTSDVGQRSPGTVVVLLSSLAALSLGAFAGLTSGTGAVLPLVLGVGSVVAAAVLYRAEVLLLVLAAFPWVNWAARQSLGGLGGVWDEALLLGSFGAVIFALAFTRRTELRSSPVLAPLALAVVAAVGSVLVRDVPSAVGVFALRVTFQPLLFFFLGQLLPRDRRWVRAAVIVFLGAGLLLALHGLFQYATHAPMPAKWVDARETAISTRAYSVVENPNGLGAFLLMASLLAVSLALSRIRFVARVGFAGVALVLAAGLAVTFSRGAWLGFIVGLVALAALSYRRLLVALAVAGLVAPLAAPPVFLDRLTFAFSPEYLAKSAAAGRLFVWRMAIERIIEHPWFGLGLGTFGGTTAFLFSYTTLWVDNFYLQIAAEGGLVLLFAFLWLLLRVGKGLVASHQAQTDPFLRAVVAGVFGGFVAVAFANFTASVWETLVVGAGFWFLAGLATSLAVGVGADLVPLRETPVDIRRVEADHTRAAALGGAAGRPTES